MSTSASLLLDPLPASTMLVKHFLCAVSSSLLGLCCSWMTKQKLHESQISTSKCEIQYSKPTTPNVEVIINIASNVAGLHVR